MSIGELSREQIESRTKESYFSAECTKPVHPLGTNDTEPTFFSVRLSENRIKNILPPYFAEGTVAVRVDM